MNKVIKILYLITANTYGGAEHSVYKLAKNLDRKIFLPFVACLGNNSVFVNRIKESGVKIFPLKMKSIFDITIIPRLYIILKKENIDIIHTQLFKSDFFGRITGKLANTQIIISTIQNMESFRRFAILNFLDRITSYFTYKIITVSNIVQDFTILKTGLPPEKFKTIYNFVDIDDYGSSFQLSYRPAIRKELGFKENNIVIGTIGRLAQQKSQKDFLIAAAWVIKKFPQARFIVAGEGPLMNNLKQMVKELSIKDKVIFTGFIKDIKKIFSIIDIFVLSSSWEGLPLTICEAMAGSVPVISTSVGGVPEIIEDGITGILIEPGNTEQLQRAICSLITDKKLALSLAKAGRIKVEKTFSLQKVLGQTQELYLEAAKSKSIY